MNFVSTLLTKVDTGNLTSIISSINTVVSVALGLLTTGVIILAIFLAYKFFTADDETKRKNAKAQMIYAIIGVVVLVVMMILAPVITDMVTKSIK